MFDLEMIRRYDAHVFAFDPTPKSLQWIAKQRVPSSMTVSPVGLADYDGEQEFGPPDNPDWDSFSALRGAGSVRCKVAKLSTLMREHGIRRYRCVENGYRGLRIRRDRRSVPIGNLSEAIARRVSPQF
jgi:hypothetical protein